MIHIDHLTKRYHDHTVVDDVTFDINQGCVFGTRYIDLPQPARVVGAVVLQQSEAR